MESISFFSLIIFQLCRNSINSSNMGTGLFARRISTVVDSWSTPVEILFVNPPSRTHSQFECHGNLSLWELSPIVSCLIWWSNRCAINYCVCLTRTKLRTIHEVWIEDLVTLFTVSSTSVGEPVVENGKTHQRTSSRKYWTRVLSSTLNLPQNESVWVHLRNSQLDLPDMNIPTIILVSRTSMWQGEQQHAIVQKLEDVSKNPLW